MGLGPWQLLPVPRRVVDGCRARCKPRLKDGTLLRYASADMPGVRVSKFVFLDNSDLTINVVKQPPGVLSDLVKGRGLLSTSYSS